MEFNVSLKNDSEINGVCLKFLKTVLFIALPLLAVLTFARVLTARWDYVIYFEIAGVSICSLPFLLAKLGLSPRKLKYVLITDIVIIIAAAYGFLYAFVMITWIFPIILASLYFDRKILIFSVFCTIAGYFGGTRLAMLFAHLHLGELPFLRDHIITHIFLFSILCNLCMLWITRVGSLMAQANSEKANLDENVAKTKALLGEISGLSNSIKMSSKDSAATAVQISEEALTAINQTSGVLSQLRSVSDSTQDYIEKAALELNKASKFKELALRLKQKSERQAVEVKGLYDRIEHISTHSEKTKEIVDELLQSFGFLNKHIEQIRKISTTASLLALNATIEASNASLSGNGFGIVADEIQNMALQINSMTSSIRQNLIDAEEHAELISTKAGTVYNKIPGLEDKIDEVIHEFQETLDYDSVLDKGFETPVNVLSDIQLLNAQLNKSIEVLSLDAQSKGNDLDGMLQGFEAISLQFRNIDTRFGSIESLAQEIASLMQHTEV